MTEQRFCAVVPTYDNPGTIRGIVDGLRPHFQEVIVVDDGSGPEGRAACEALSREGLATVVHRARNGGKGAAVKTGLAAARERGFTHALQVDADGQHDLADVPRLLDASRREPEALVLGEPVFDHSAPTSRRVARRITVFWVTLEAGRGVIADAMCGFRVYPVDAALAVRARGDAMDFDPEIAVLLSWTGRPVINVPTRVRYVDASEGGISHFRMFRDNVAISWMHARLCVRKVFGFLFGGLIRRLFGRRALPG